MGITSVIFVYGFVIIIELVYPYCCVWIICVCVWIIIELVYPYCC